MENDLRKLSHSEIFAVVPDGAIRRIAVSWYPRDGSPVYQLDNVYSSGMIESCCIHDLQVWITSACEEKRQEHVW